MRSLPALEMAVDAAVLTVQHRRDVIRSPTGSRGRFGDTCGAAPDARLVEERRGPRTRRCATRRPSWEWTTALEIARSRSNCPLTHPALWSSLAVVPPVHPELADTPMALGDALRTPDSPSSVAAHDLVAALRVDRLESNQAPVGAVTMLKRGDVVDRYVVHTLLGRGGMGVVYAAYDPELDRKVALKLLLPQAGGGPHSVGRVRLLREAQALGKLAHPNVVAVYDVGQRDEQVWIAMEFVVGQTLGAWARERTRRWPEVVQVLTDAARGVAAAHRGGLVHRDLKPDNVMIGNDGRVRVMDFGLAHGRALATEELAIATTLASDSDTPPTVAALALSLTRAGAIMGSPAYMAPEQWEGREVEAAADQFGWSVMAWELLYGERPFIGETLIALAAAVAAGQRRPPPPGRRVPGWLRRIIERGLAPQPEQRWPTMASLLAALERGSTRSRLRTAALVLAGVLSLVAVLGVISFMAWRAAQTRDELAQGREKAAVVKEEEASLAARSARNVRRMTAVDRSIQDHHIALALGLLREVESTVPSIEVPGWSRAVAQALAIRGREVVVFASQQGEIKSAVFSRDGTRVLTTAENTAQIWDATTGMAVVILRGHEREIETASFDAGGARVVTGSADHTGRVWDATTGAELAVLQGHELWVRSAEFTPDGTRIMTSDNVTERVWDANTGAEIIALRTELAQTMYRMDEWGTMRPESVGRVRPAPRRRGGVPVPPMVPPTVLATYHDDMRGDMKILRKEPVEVEEPPFGPDGERVVREPVDQSVWVTHATIEEPQRLRGHTGRVVTAAFSPDGTRIVTGSTDGTARVWDSQTGVEVAILGEHAGPLVAAMFRPGGAQILTVAGDTASLWDITTGAELAILRGHTRALKSVVWSPNGSFLLTTGLDGARVWERGVLVAMLGEPEEWMQSAGWNQDGARVVAVWSDEKVRVWDTKTRAEVEPVDADLEIKSMLLQREADAAIRPPPSRAANPRRGSPVVLSQALSPDGTRKVTTTKGGSVQVSDAATGADLAVFLGHAGPARTAAFSPDGTRVVTGSNDGTARVWDARTGAEIAVILGHEAPVMSAVFSPDGMRVATGSRDGTARVSDARTGAELAVLRGHEGGVEAVTFSPDGATVATASEDGTARVWWGVGPGQDFIALRLLWLGTRHCPSIADRVRLLGEDPQTANASHRGCETMIRCMDQQRADASVMTWFACLARALGPEHPYFADSLNIP